MTPTGKKLLDSLSRSNNPVVQFGKGLATLPNRIVSGVGQGLSTTMNRAVPSLLMQAQAKRNLARQRQVFNLQGSGNYQQAGNLLQRGSGSQQIVNASRKLDPFPYQSKHRFDLSPQDRTAAFRSAGAGTESILAGLGFRNPLSLTATAGLSGTIGGTIAKATNQNVPYAIGAGISNAPVYAGINPITDKAITAVGGNAMKQLWQRAFVHGGANVAEDMGLTLASEGRMPTLAENATSFVIGGAFPVGRSAWNKITNRIKIEFPKASPKEVEKKAKDFIRDVAGRFAKQKQAAKNEPVYYGDLRESLGLSRHGDPTVPIGMQTKPKGGMEAVFEAQKLKDANKGVQTGRTSLETAQSTNLKPPQTTEIPQSQPPKDAGQGGIPKNPSLEGNIPQNDEGLVAKLTQALREAKPLRGAQESLYSKARGVKFAKMMGARGRVSGEQGFRAELGALKGELPKVQYESIRQQFDQPSVDRLFDMVRQHQGIGEWDKITAQGGLAKILGQEGGAVPTRGEIEKLYEVFGKDFTEALLSKRTMFQKLGEAGMQAYNLPRSIMAGAGDLSATFMQNLLFAYRHPVMTAKNFIREVQMFASESYFKASQQEITQRPTYELMRKAKLALTDTGPLVSKREEQFMSSWAEQIPGLGGLIKASGRAYTGFINRMRADVFDQMVTNFKNSGGDVNDARFLKSLGEFVNAGTGRGSLGVLERSAPVLSQGLFSARKLAGAVQMINPKFYIDAHPAVRKEALLTMLSFLGGGLTITTMADLAGAEVGKDPTSADFGKIKIGNTRFNVWGSYQQIAVLMARMLKGYGTSSTTGKKFTLNEGYKPVTRLDLISRFFESKEHPTLSLMVGALKGQNQIGEPFDLPTEVLNRFIPMVLADAYDLYKEHGSVGLLGTIPTILGIPSQTYGRQIPTIETTDSGNPSVRLKNVPGIAEDVINKVRGESPSNIPESEWKPFIDAKKKETELGILKEEMKSGQKTEPGKSKSATYFFDGVDNKGYELNGKFVYTNEDGEIKTKTIKSIEKSQKAEEKGIIEANYSLVKDRLTRAKNYKDLYQVNQQYLNYLKDYQKKLDPKADQKEIITIQNKIEDLEATLAKGIKSGSGKKLVSDAQLLSAYKKALQAAMATPKNKIVSSSQLDSFRLPQIKRTEIKSLV